MDEVEPGVIAAVAAPAAADDDDSGGFPRDGVRICIAAEDVGVSLLNLEVISKIKIRSVMWMCVCKIFNTCIGVCFFTQQASCIFCQSNDRKSIQY